MRFHLLESRNKKIEMHYFNLFFSSCLIFFLITLGYYLDGQKAFGFESEIEDNKKKQDSILDKYDVQISMKVDCSECNSTQTREQHAILVSKPKQTNNYDNSGDNRILSKGFSSTNSSLGNTITQENNPIQTNINSPSIKLYQYNIQMNININCDGCNANMMSGQDATMFTDAAQGNSYKKDFENRWAKAFNWHPDSN